MNVLLLSPYPERLLPTLHQYGDEVIVMTDRLTREYCIDSHIDFIVSFGYRHIIPLDILSLYPSRAINLHISMLPSARGAHPNFWSIVESTTPGVTIHLIDQGLDTGNILVQQEIAIDLLSETFRSSYLKLIDAIERIFALNWKYFRTGSCCGWKQIGTATFHHASEIHDWEEFLPQSWDTPIHLFLSLAKVKISQQHLCL